MLEEMKPGSKLSPRSWEDGCGNNWREDRLSHADPCRRTKTDLRGLCHKPSHIKLSFSSSIHKLPQTYGSLFLEDLAVEN